MNILTNQQFLELLLQGFWITAAVSSMAVVGSFMLGLSAALLQSAGGPVVSFMSKAYEELFRNIPFIVLIFFFYFGLPVLGVFISPFFTGVLALSVAVGAYNTAIIRAGIDQVDKDIVSAAVSFGHSKYQIYSRILLPIALRTSIRPLGSMFANLILTSSILSTITLNELTGSAKIIASYTFKPFEVYVLLMLFYCVLTYAITILINLMHTRMNKIMVN
ncbi:MAG: amino acid ABC transporter permease [Gammaproteobacteria bacterium]|nr:amino acid ABC transporter permease [Gammaproteobacteria bacterium]